MFVVLWVFNYWIARMSPRLQTPRVSVTASRTADIVTAAMHIACVYTYGCALHSHRLSLVPLTLFHSANAMVLQQTLQDQDHSCAHAREELFFSLPQHLPIRHMAAMPDHIHTHTWHHPSCTHCLHTTRLTNNTLHTRCGWANSTQLATWRWPAS